MRAVWNGQWLRLEFETGSEFLLSVAETQEFEAYVKRCIETNNACGGN